MFLRPSGALYPLLHHGAHALVSLSPEEVQGRGVRICDFCVYGPYPILPQPAFGLPQEEDAHAFAAEGLLHEYYVYVAVLPELPGLGLEPYEAYWKAPGEGDLYRARVSFRMPEQDSLGPFFVHPQAGKAYPSCLRPEVQNPFHVPWLEVPDGYLRIHMSAPRTVRERPVMSGMRRLSLAAILSFECENSLASGRSSASVATLAARRDMAGLKER